MSYSYELHAKEFDIGSVRMFKLLREQGVIDENNLSHQKHINAKRFYVGMTPYKYPDGTSAVNYTLRIPPKDELFIRCLLSQVGWSRRGGAQTA